MTLIYSYDYICFSILVKEYNPSLKKESEIKIKQRIKYHKVGAYDQNRIENIRAFCKDLSSELKNYQNSSYYKKTESFYAEMEDFNITQINLDYKEKYPNISEENLRVMIDYMIRYCYLH